MCVVVVPGLRPGSGERFWNVWLAAGRQGQLHAALPFMTNLPRLTFIAHLPHRPVSARVVLVPDRLGMGRLHHLQRIGLCAHRRQPPSRAGCMRLVESAGNPCVVSPSPTLSGVLGSIELS
jgi:hypothetical protein